jgi:hypothetical protein
MPDQAGWIVKRNATDPTSGSLREMNLISRSLRELEGHACRARRNAMDDSTWRGGRDERVPPRGDSESLFPRIDSDVLNWSWNQTSGGFLERAD